MIHLIYMAAGNSRRFGNANKLLQNWQGKPLYFHTFEKLLRIREKDPQNISLTVVTQYPEIYQEVKIHPGVHAVFCKESRLGVSYTIKAGIRAVEEAYTPERKECCFAEEEISSETETEKKKSWDYLMFTVADQPNLSEQSIEKLIRAANLQVRQDKSAGHSSNRAADRRFRQGYTSLPPVFSLRCGDRIGNPGMFRADLIPELMQLEGDKGGRAVLKQHACCYVEIKSEEEFSDIDTEEQMKKK